MLEQLKNTDFLGPFVGKTVVDIAYEQNFPMYDTGPVVKISFDDDTWLVFCLDTAEVMRCLETQN
jgi:hypothetical protein